MSNARQVDLLLSGIFGLDGAPLSSGKVYCYNAGSSTLKNVYNDVGLTVASENPVILDENGKAIKYALGSYKLVVKDSNDSTLYTYDNLTYGFNPESVTADYSGSIYLASMGGDSSAIQGSTTLTTPISSLAEGMRFVFQSPFDCSASATITIDNADAADLYIADGSTPVTAGYIEEGQFYEIIYDGSVFRVLSTTGAIGTDKIGTGVVAGSNMQASAIDTTQLNDGAVTTDKLADSSVTTAKIIDGAITTDKVADGAVTTAKLNDSAVTTNKIADSAITKTKFASFAILDNLTETYSEAGTYYAGLGKIIFESTAPYGSTVTLKFDSSSVRTGIPLCFNKKYSGSTFMIEVYSGPTMIAQYEVSAFRILIRSGSNNWSSLHAG